MVGTARMEGVSQHDSRGMLDAEQGNDNIHYAVPYDHLVCNGISEYVPQAEWPSECGSGPNDATYGVNWRHYTIIAPELAAMRTPGFLWTIDTTDPTKPFLVSKWRLPGEGTLANGSSTLQPTSLEDTSTAPIMEILGKWSCVLDPLPCGELGN